MNLEAIKALSYAELGERKIYPHQEVGIKYDHCMRVAALAVNLRKMIFPEDTTHDELLLAVGYLHDIKNGEPEHAQRGADRARELLEGTDYCTPEEMEEICAIIGIHDQREPDTDRHSRYAKLQQDADIIDHKGVIELFAATLWQANNGGNFESTANSILKNPHTEGDRNWLNFEQSKKVYDERVEISLSTARRMLEEAAGEP